MGRRCSLWYIINNRTMPGSIVDSYIYDPVDVPDMCVCGVFFGGSNFLPKWKLLLLKKTGGKI